MQDAGLATLDLDLVAHDVMAPGAAAYDAVVAEFGPGIVGAGGRIDRPALAGRVFADPGARNRLNALVHPRVREEEDRRAAALAAADAALLVTDAALLVEAGYHLRFDRLVVVHCPPEEQLRRLRLRDGLDEPAARARLRAQMPIDEKRSFAHFAGRHLGAVRADGRARSTRSSRSWWPCPGGASGAWRARAPGPRSRSGRRRALGA